jgi:predicted Fe-Mo cluster-binding NifX family protein
MKIAIPLFKGRVAPHFGSSSRALLVEIAHGTVLQEAEWAVGGAGAMEMASHLVHLGVEKVVCGGISRLHKQWLMDKGIIVEDNKKGQVRKIVEELLSEHGI